MRGQRAKAKGTIAALAALCLLGTSLASAEIAQNGDLRVAIDGKMTPHALPRTGTAPVSVSVGGHISTTDKGLPPQLNTLRIEINRHGRLDYKGLPVCHKQDIQPATTAQALAACRSALVGQGTFSADVVLSGQAPYPSKGHLLVFNGKEGGHQVLYGQIYTPQPFTNSFVLVFQISSLGHGTFGTALTASSLAKTLGSWGYVTGIEMTLKRTYSYRGTRHSYISAGCPAPKGTSKVAFSLAKASFAFEGGKRLSETLVRSCRAGG
jgi:hypothetical protein